MSRKKFLFGGILLVLLIGAGGLVWYTRLRTPTSTTATQQTAALERGALSAIVSGAGNIYAPQQAKLSFSTTGAVVTKVNAQVGAQVKAGDVLAQVDDSQLQEALKTAQANLASAQAQYDAVRAPATTEELAAAEAKVRAAQESYDAAVASLKDLQAPATALKMQAAASTLASAQESYKSALAKSQMTDQQITVARATLETARISLESAQAAYDRVAWRDDVTHSSEATALQTATISYASAKAQYDLTLAAMNNSELETAKATLAQAQTDYNTLKQGATVQELATAQAAVDSALQALTQAKTDLNTLKGGATAQELASAQASLQSAQEAYTTAARALEGTQLTAPFDGTVAEVDLYVGQTPTSGTTAIVLSNLNDLEIQLTMSEVDIAEIKTGQKVELTFDALAGKTYTGKVLSVSPVGTTTSGVVNYTVIVGLDKTDSAILPGMTAAASIITAERQDTLLAPNRALKTQGTNRTMTLVLDGRNVSLIVKTGLAGEAYTEILSATTSDGTPVNLQAGDLVVLNTTTSNSSSNSNAGPGLGGGLIGGGPPAN